MVRLTACLLGLGLAAVACQSQNLKATVQHSPSVPSRWQQVDLPLMPEGTRKAVYDAARDSLWVVSLVPPQDPSASEYVTVTRVDASTHEVTQTGLHLKAHQFYQAAAALDASGDLWMAWDRNLLRYDPSTNAVQSFALPSFASLGVHVSLYSGEGNFVAVAIDSKARCGGPRTRLRRCSGSTRPHESGTGSSTCRGSPTTQPRSRPRVPGC